MSSTRHQARIAGLWYLAMIVLGLPGLIVIPARLIVRGDAVATADHIRAALPLFQLGIGSELVGEVLYVFLVLALHRLFEAVSRNTALLMVALVLVSVAIGMFASVFELAAFIVLAGPAFLSTFSHAQLDALAYLFIRLHSQAILVAEIFWGLWLVPFGLLVIRSGFLPRLLGVLLLIAAPGYLLRVAGNMFPALRALDSIGGILSLGEMPIIFWLAVVGAKDEPQP